jgi:glycosyltransferase involved in cell wall biosynthesis
MTTMSRETAGTIAYVIRMFPQTSETFIANEILALENLGAPLRLFSYRTPQQEVAHECVRRIQTPVEYLADPLWRAPLHMLRANVAAYRFSPAGYRKAARYAFRQAVRLRQPIQLGRLFQAGCLAERLSAGLPRRLHAHFARGATEVAMLVSMMTGVRMSFTAHAADIYTARREDLRRKIAAADFVVTCTQTNVDYLREVAGDYPSENIVRCYHGVDVEKFAPATRPDRQELPLILAAGRLVEKKGFHYLLEALAELRARGYEARCLIVGEGPERRRLEAAVRALGLAQMVSLRGACSQEELLRLYHEADVFALPCTVVDSGDRDGIPNVILEAMAAGLPVISTRVSGVTEAVEDGHNGLLTQERDVPALASALVRLLDDPALAAQLGANARATMVEKFDARLHIASLAELFGETVAPSLPARELVQV